MLPPDWSLEYIYDLFTRGFTLAELAKIVPFPCTPDEIARYLDVFESRYKWQ